MGEGQWDAFKQYQSQLRQSRAEKAQRISEQQQRKQNDSAQQQIAREQARKEREQHIAEQKRLAEQRANEKLQREEEALNALLAESAEALRKANEKTHEAQRKAQEVQRLRQSVKSGISPIETSFIETWRATYPTIGLEPQYGIGRYRVDFAHVASKTVIELDGHQYHSTRKARTKDAQRERWIQAQGWHVVRFTGSEIFGDVENCVHQTAEIIAQRIKEAR